MTKTTQKQIKRTYMSFDDDPLVVTIKPEVRQVPYYGNNGRRHYAIDELRVAFTADNRILEYKNGIPATVEEDSLYRIAFYGRQQVTYPQKEKRNYYKKGDILAISELDLHWFRKIFPLEFSSESDGFIELLLWLLDIKQSIRVGWLIDTVQTTDPRNFDGYVTFTRVMFVKGDQGEDIPYPIRTAEKISFTRFQLHEQICGTWDLAASLANLGEIIKIWESVNMTILSWYVGGITGPIRKKAGAFILKKVSKQIGEKLAIKLAEMIAEGFVKSFVTELIKGLAGRFNERSMKTMITAQDTLTESDERIIIEEIGIAVTKATLGKLSKLNSQGWGKGIVQFAGESRWSKFTYEAADWVAKEIGKIGISGFEKMLIVVIKSVHNNGAGVSPQMLKAMEEAYAPLLSPTKWLDRFVKWGTTKMNSVIST